MTQLTITAVAGCPHLPYVKYLERWLPKAIAQMKNAPKEIAISLVGSTKMAKLHWDFMRIEGETDVLTFELEHDLREKVTEGEVVICVPVAKKESQRRGVTIEQELLLYALHGVLHLSGYDDLSPAEHTKMHAEEDRILKKIGIGEVFHRPTKSAGKSKSK